MHSYRVHQAFAAQTHIQAFNAWNTAAFRNGRVTNLCGVQTVHRTCSFTWNCPKPKTWQGVFHLLVELPWLQLVILVMVAASVRDSSAWWMMLDFVREVLPVKFERNVTHQNETRKPNTKGMKNTLFWWLCPKDVHLTVASTTLTVQLARPRSFMSSRSKKLSWWPLRWWWMFLSRERGDIGSVKTDRRRLWKLSGSHSYHDNVALSMLKLLRHVGFSNLGSLRNILLRGFGTVCSGCCKPACLLSETQKAG